MECGVAILVWSTDETWVCLVHRAPWKWVFEVWEAYWVFDREHIRVGVVGNISACHADAPGSIPGHGVTLFVSCTLRIILLAGISNNFVLFLVTNYRGLINYASIAQLAEHLLRKEKVTSSILVGGYLFAWSSWLWRSPHTREVPSSSLGANITYIFCMNPK